MLVLLLLFLGGVLVFLLGLLDGVLVVFLSLVLCLGILVVLVSLICGSTNTTRHSGITTKVVVLVVGISEGRIVLACYARLMGCRA